MVSSCVFYAEAEFPDHHFKLTVFFSQDFDQAVHVWA